MDRPVARVLDLVPETSQSILGLSVEEARRRVLAADPAGVLGIRGSFALVARDGERVCLARSLDRPLRYFLAKEADGPLLVVAERIDEIRRCLEAEGYGAQFQPSYTRMAPAHHVTTIRLVGCPDPNPRAPCRRTSR
jgi:asparagine synthase (glutamine-hydrolysing)